MFVLYNILQLVLLPVFLPFITIFVLLASKYRDRVPARLGFGLQNKITSLNSTGPTLWLHALSVGEVTSAVPLVAGYREKYPDSSIVVSVTTRTGKKVADELLDSLADHIIDGPFDLLPVIHRFTLTINPSLFVLVETDLWPNTLLYLKQKDIPTILVNGRVSEKSMEGYRRFGFFFKPMFLSFSYLCMQTKRDFDKLHKLGIPADKLRTLGNLKFDTSAGNDRDRATELKRLLPENRTIFTCGSTHPGEESILIDCYTELKKEHPDLFMILAPRNSKRASEIQKIAENKGLTTNLRSEKLESSKKETDILIVDTIGELVTFYALSELAFVGGSLVKKGGHNPIEPATMGIPTVFGPNMQDFSEITETLIELGGAQMAKDADQLTQLISTLLYSPELRDKQGQAARTFVQTQRGVINNHMELIQQLL